MAWCCGKIGFEDKSFLEHLAKQSIEIIREFVTQDLANTAWAMATLLERRGELLKALGEQAAEKLHLFLRLGAPFRAYVKDNSRLI